MKLSIWMEVNNLRTCKVARLFKVSSAHIYKIIYDKNIPRPKVIERYFFATYGAVTLNDSYGICTELLEKKNYLNN